VDLLYHDSGGSHGRSFPSGHTAMVVIALGTLALLVAAERPDWTGRLLLAAAATSLLVAVALVYAGFHWFSDAVASLALAAAAVGFVAARVPPGSQPSSRSSPYV
jgi:undecaprenyl-diphosphatase